jgi:glycosyltransferase involved in cell wall biosynthesis
MPRRISVPRSAAGPPSAADCPSGPWEILDGGKYGRLVPCRDPQSLAEAIIATLDAPVSRQALIDRAQVFSAKAAVDRYSEVLESCRAMRSRV